MGGVIRCQKFKCPSGTFCLDNEDYTSNCVETSKGATMGEGGGGLRMTQWIRQGKKGLSALDLTGGG